MFGAKYTAMVAPGAIEPTTSTSRTTSPSALFGSPVGAFPAPSTDTAVTLGVVARPSPLKYARRSAARYPPPSSMMATVSPAPVTLVGNW